MDKRILKVFNLDNNKFSDLSDICDNSIPSGSFVLPGFVDLHTHGVSGYEFEDASEADIESMLTAYARLGTLYLLPTLGTVDFDRICTAADNILAAAVKTEGSSKHAKILGIHFECRYLSAVKAGAHDKSLLKSPDVVEAKLLIDKVYEAEKALGIRLHVHFTIAPELDGGLDFIKYAESRGATVGIGHTDADAETAKKALDMGAVSFTHTFNAMRPIHHRTSSALTTALTSNAYVEVICDGKHILPEIVSLIKTAKNDNKVVLITDSVGAGIPEGEEFEFLSHKARVSGGVAVQSDGTIAGSVISMADGFKNYMRFTGATPEQAVMAAVANPLNMINALDLVKARYKGLKDFIVLDKDCNLTAVYTGGKKILHSL